MSTSDDAAKTQRAVPRVDHQDPVSAIASRGRELLLEHVRDAYAEAARAEADIIDFDPPRLEELARQAAARADGVQWRRALAEAAAEHFQITVTDALARPEVIEAQHLVGAPSYEQSLAELVGEPMEPPAAAAEPVAPNSTDAAPDPPMGVPAPEPNLSASAVDPSTEIDPPTEEVQLDVLPPQAAGELPAGDGPEERSPIDPDAEITITAMHLGGVTNLPTAGDALELRLSRHGLDILPSDGDIIGRLPWREIVDIAVTAPRGHLLHRGHEAAQITVHTAHGEAYFEAPGFAAPTLRAEIGPLVEAHRSNR